MSETDRIPIDELFDRRLEFPDRDAGKRFEQLVGVGDAKTRLTKLLAVLVNPEGPRAWARKYHPQATALLDYVERRPPLAILAGDVGTGKTELAETVGHAVAQQEHIAVTLYPLSLATRGTGKVGEMTRLISAAFEAVIHAAGRLSRSNTGKTGAGIILLVDEADALTQSRESGQMHHEDRAGVNAFIRGVDRLASKGLPVAVVLCTNRLSAIDPAVQRRAADILEFHRPNDAQRLAVIQGPLESIGFSVAQIREIVKLSGPAAASKHGYTFSDLTQRLLPTLVLDAYPDRAVSFTRACELVATIKPTPPFRGEL